MKKHHCIQSFGTKNALMRGFNKIPLAMRITLFMLFCVIGCISANNSYAQNTMLNITSQDKMISEVLNEIEQETEFTFFYNNKEVDVKRRVSVQAKSENIFEVLDKIFKGTGVVYKVLDKSIILSNKSVNAPLASTQQKGVIQGKVLDSAGETIIGANVIVKGTTNGAVTDIDGNFTLNAEEGVTLLITFIGYKNQELVVGKQTTGIVITMRDDNELLDEVVVVGYAVGNKRSVSGAVERVTADKMNSGFVATPVDAIRSKVSGLTISQNGGDPTSTPTVRLRGTSSLTGETGPLIVIDGMFADIDMMNSLATSDIEEITILKDASETAQYGSRGASGVIVVTTQKGKEGVARVDYTGQMGASVVYKNLDILTADEWRAANTALDAHGVDHGYSNNFLKEIQNDVVLQQNHTVSLTMGSQKANMRASVGVNTRDGQVKGTSNNNYNMKLNASLNTLKDKVTIELGLLGSRRDRKSSSSQNLYYSASQFNPTYPNFRNPETGEWDYDPAAQQITNPLGQLEQVRDMENERATATARVTYKIMKGFNFSAYGSYNYSNTLNKEYTPNNISQGQSTNGSAKITNSNMSSLMGNLQLTYMKDFGKHSFNVLALAEAIRDKYFSFNAGATGFDTNYFLYNNLSAGANVSYGSVGSDAYENTIVSYMGRFNYMYDSRYVLTINARTDGSSKLGNNHKWGFFPSVSVAWLINNEAFMKDIEAINNLKLRVGYGVSGNQNGISAYRSLAVMSPSGLTNVNGSNAVSFAYSRNDNPDLKWETKYTFNIGADLGMFDNRLRATVDYYRSTTKNLLYSYSVPVPPFLYNTLLANIGKMTNSGFEFSLSGDIIREKDWGLTIGGNVAYQKNKLVSLTGKYNGEVLTPAQYVSRNSVDNCGGLTQNTGVIYMSEGEPVGYFRLPKFKEFNVSENGHKQFVLVDQDGDGYVRTADDSADRVNCGQATPKFIMGSSIQVRYKDFDLSTQLSGAFGHKIYNATSMLYYNMANFPSYNVLADAVNKQIYDIQLSDYWLEKGDYVNIDYISLGYNAPLKKLKLSSYLQKLRVALSCNNVHTFTGYSGMTPLLDIGSTAGGLDDRGIYPISRTFTLSLQVSF
jgi:TonB-linked SusC/RagA family outer membrane protein